MVVFVSSSYEDLKYVRDHIRGLLRELRITPIVFEKNEVTVSPHETILDACKRKVERCDGFILVIGQRCSSITQKEYEAAIVSQKPIFPLIERKLYYQYQLFKQEPSIFIPPEKVNDCNILKQFEFIQIVEKQGLGSPLTPFEGLEEIDEYLKNSFVDLLCVALKGPKIDEKKQSIMYQNVDLSSLSQYKTSGRKIRVQVHTQCNQKCPWCHNDEYDRNEIDSVNTEFLECLCKRIANTTTQSSFPWVKPYFVLTGGEPLLNPPLLLKLIKLRPESTSVVTNASVLSLKLINELPKSLRSIHISHNPFDLKLIGFQGDSGEDHKHYYWEQKIDNIKGLLSKTRIPIRFNTVIYKNNPLLVDDYISFLKKSFSEPVIGRRITSIAFIQATRVNLNPSEESIIEPELDIFTLAEKWVDRKKQENSASKMALCDVIGSMRRKVIDNYQDLRIEFIKVNCDDKVDCIRRCFDCVREKDISLSADGRIRVCTRWNNELNPFYTYAHIDVSEPINGIRSMISRQYGFVGFYGHIPMIVQILCGNNITKHLDRDALLSDQEIKDVCSTLGLPFRGRENFETSLGFYPDLIRIILHDEAKISPIYREGSVAPKVHRNSIDLCILLIKDAYRIARAIRLERRHKARIQGRRKEQRLNLALLSIVFLCIDERLFSKVSTKLVVGRTRALLEEISSGQPTDERFLTLSSYIIGSIALESEKGETVRRYIEGVLTENQIEHSALLNYLLGFILNRERSFEEAEKRFSIALKIVNKEIDTNPDSNDIFTRLFYEVRCESYRGIASAMKDRKDKALETEHYYLLSNFYAAKDKAASRYSTLFSDGYQAFKMFFEQEFEQSENVQKGYEAHIKLNDSVLHEPDFYASLIRLGLLELALGEIYDAVRRLEHTKKLFSYKGLLTDQEFLNSLLCDFILQVALLKVGRDMNLPSIHTIEISHCKSVDERDIRCVQRDARYLRMYLEKLEHNDIKPDSMKYILDNLNLFIEKRLEPLAKIASSSYNE